MTKYIDIEDMVDQSLYQINEVYHIYYKGKRVHLNHAEYSSINGARAGIRNYFKYKIENCFPNLDLKEGLTEVMDLIEIRKVTYQCNRRKVYYMSPQFKKSDVINVKHDSGEESYFSLRNKSVSGNLTGDTYASLHGLCTNLS